MSRTIGVDRTAVAARLEVIADALELQHQDWMALAHCDEQVIRFALIHGQSLDWIISGDVRPLLRSAARRG